MSKKLIYITNYDMKRLRELIMVAREFGNGGKKYLSDLENELDNGVVVDSRE
ncbi:MAG: transcription elongation factor GreAB, partial [Candidatus Atribacteria bacterium]|nr:transcription elongation factor GreAB [Candidatus Atribacteria bacterium]